MSIREDIKILLVKENLTLVDLANELSIRFNRKITANSLSKKLSRNTIQYELVKNILDCIGYNINFEKKH